MEIFIAALLSDDPDGRLRGDEETGSGVYGFQIDDVQTGRKRRSVRPGAVPQELALG
jgi:hypothetical protein